MLALLILQLLGEFGSLRCSMLSFQLGETVVEVLQLSIQINGFLLLLEVLKLHMLAFLFFVRLRWTTLLRQHLQVVIGVICTLLQISILTLYFDFRQSFLGYLDDFDGVMNYFCHDLLSISWRAT